MAKGGKRDRSSRVFKTLAIILAFVLIVGTVPASAASSNQVEFKTKKQFLAELAKAGAETIVFSTQKEIKFTIPSSETSANKKVIINAPNATITNKASLKGITLNETKAFTEKGLGNSITVKSNETTITIAKGSEVAKMTVAADKVDIKVLSKAVVGDIVCKLKSAEITVDVAKKADVNITLSKKTNLTVTGDKAADVDITSKAKNSIVTSSVPIEVTAEKDLKLKLKEGAEGSVIDSMSEDVNVKVSGTAADEVTEKVAGETVKEPEKKEEKSEEKKEETSTTSSTSDQSQSSGGYTPVILPTTYSVTLETSGEDIKSAELFIGDTKITSGTKVQPGTYVQLVVSIKSGLYPRVTVNGQDTEVYVPGNYETDGYVESVFRILIEANTTVKLTSTEPVVTFNSPENGTVSVKKQGGSEIQSGTQLIAYDWYEIHVKPDNGYFPRIKRNGFLEELRNDYQGGWVVYFSGNGFWVDINGCVDLEVEFVPTETEYTITLDQPTQGVITLAEKASGKVLASGDKVKAGTLVTATYTLGNEYIIHGINLSYEEENRGHGTVSFSTGSYSVDTVINADTKIMATYGAHLINIDTSWIGDSVSGKLEIETFDGLSSTIDKSLTTLLGEEEEKERIVVHLNYPGTKVISLTDNDVDKTSFVADSDNHVHVYERELSNDTNINIVAVLGKLNVNYVKVHLAEVANAEVQLSYLLSGKTVTVAEGEEGFVPEGTDITVTVAPENGYEVSSVKAGDATVTAANGEYKYTVSADTTFTITTAQKQNHVILSADATSIRTATTAAFTVSGAAIAATGTAFDLKVGDTKYATVFVPNDPVTTGAAISLEGHITVDQTALVDVLDFSAFSSSNTGDALFTSYVLDEILKKFNRVATVYYPAGVSAKPQRFVGNQTFSAKPNS